MCVESAVLRTRKSNGGLLGIVMHSYVGVENLPMGDPKVELKNVHGDRIRFI